MFSKTSLRLYTCETAISTAESNSQSAMTAALNSYTGSMYAADNTFNELASGLACLYTDAVEIIDNGGTIGNNYFDNANEDADVCFVAGTPILMADGTSKPITTTNKSKSF